MRFRVTVISCALVALSAPPAFADDLATVIRIADDADKQIAKRIEGQTVDLDVTLVRERTGPIEDGLSRQFQTATRIAEERGADVVVWFRRDDDATIVYVADPRAGTLFARRIGAASDTAVAEAAALVVRSALRALAAGGTIGVEAPPPPPPEPETDPEPPPDPKPAPPPPPPPTRSTPTRWHAAVGWQASIDGESPSGQHGLAVEIGFARRRFTLALAGVASLPVTLEDDLTAVDLARHSVAIAALYSVHRTDTLDVSIGLAVGGAAFARSTTATKDPGVAATPATTTLAGVIGPELRARWTLSPGAGIAIDLTVGADAVAGAPELGYEVDGTFEVRNSLWPAQPKVGLRMVVQSGTTQNR